MEMNVPSLRAESLVSSDPVTGRRESGMFRV